MDRVSFWQNYHIRFWQSSRQAAGKEKASWADLLLPITVTATSDSDIAPLQLACKMYDVCRGGIPDKVVVKDVGLLGGVAVARSAALLVKRV